MATAIEATYPFRFRGIVQSLRLAAYSVRVWGIRRKELFVFSIMVTRLNRWNRALVPSLWTTWTFKASMAIRQKTLKMALTTVSTKTPSSHGRPAPSSHCDLASDRWLDRTAATRRSLRAERRGRRFVATNTNDAYPRSQKIFIRSRDAPISYKRLRGRLLTLSRG